MVLTGFINRRIVHPLGELLKQGLTPRRIAVTMSLGIVIGLFPIPGSTTFLCTGAALLLHLNLPAIQLFNWLVFPLQLVLVFPFILMGNYLFGREPITLTAPQVTELFKTDFWYAVQSLGGIVIHAALVWFLFAVPVCIILYYVFAPLLGKMDFAKIHRE
jgi:uncharacterized protein (DUF2062 family)